MKINWEVLSYIFAISIALAAVVSPIITSIINNNHQSRLENTKNYELAKRKALENYIENASKCFDSPSLLEKENYIKSANTLYIYFSKIPIGVDDLLGIKGDTFNEQLTSIIQDLSKQIAKE